jgi:SAM-dependent methyltransferase
MEAAPECTICRRAGYAPAYDVWPRPPMAEVQAIYRGAYFANPAFDTTDGDSYYGYRDQAEDRPNVERRMDEILERAERHVGRGRLLDVGCGLGFMVGTAARRGWDAHGVDLNPDAVAWARANVSDQIEVGTLGSLDAADGSFDCITLLDLIEHVADPRTELGPVARALRPGGLLVIVTPDAGSIVSRALGSHWLEMKRAPEHLHFFTRAGLTDMLSSEGFDVVDVRSIGKITSIRTLLSDLKFYSRPLFNGVERVLDRLHLADRIVDIDPHTKFCAYARRRST